MSAAPAEWRRFALAPARAHGPPVGIARLRDAPADFVVDERLGYEPDGAGQHLLLRVEKTGRDTLAVARELARAAGVAVREVGFAGLKDRHAVTRQSFSVPAPRVPPDWAALQLPGVRVLAAVPHGRKLRRGALRANGFVLVLREFAAGTGATDVAAALDARLAAIDRHGVPNYFGPQRFGRDGANLDALAAVLAGAPLPRGREARAFVLSSARALLFNAVLDARVQAGDWDRLLPGELVNLDGRNSFFRADEPDPALLARCAAGDVHPTGPLAGRAGAAPSAAVAAREAAALAPFAEVAALLERSGLDAARRPLRVRPRELRASRDGATLALEFVLPAGAYATALVRELVDVGGGGVLQQEEGDDA